jgi:hypothetical protein
MSDSSDLPEAYPRELVELAYLDDGTALELRPILPDDRARLERTFHRLSPLSLYRRFFTPVPRPNPALLDRLVHVDYTHRLALVALVGDEVIAVARYDRLPVRDEAEVAVIVEDAWQGRGEAPQHAGGDAAAARARGIGWFIAGVQGENRPMMGLLKVLSDELESTLVDGEHQVRIGLSGVRPGF